MSDKPQMTSPSAGMNLGDSVYERLLSERIIFLGTQVDDEIANKLCAQILLLSAEDQLAIFRSTLTPQAVPLPQAWRSTTP